LELDVKVKHRIWIEVNGESIIGPGGYDILSAIDRTGSLSRAARELGVSYRFLWNYIDKMEKRLGFPVINGWRGGARKGGARLTDKGKQLLLIYGEIMSDMAKLTPKWEDAVKRFLSTHES